MRRPVLLALIGLAGCNIPEHIAVDPKYLVEGPDGWKQAADIIAADFGTDRPTIYWYGPYGLNCGGGLGFIDNDGHCVDGWTGRNAILLALPRPSSQRPCETGLPHEMAHHAWYEEGHETAAIWGPGGRVESIAARLAEMGL